MKLTHAAAASILLLGAPLLASAPSQAAAALSCSAHMQDSTPGQYTYDRVYVKTAGHAGIRATAHYKTTSTSKSGKANATGHGSVQFYISGATPGVRVTVDVTVTKGGHSGHCGTSFTPHK